MQIFNVTINGIGRFRARNNGYYGRFDVMDFSEARLAKAA